MRSTAVRAVSAQKQLLCPCRAMGPRDKPEDDILSVVILGLVPRIHFSARSTVGDCGSAVLQAAAFFPAGRWVLGTSPRMTLSGLIGEYETTAPCRAVRHPRPRPKSGIPDFGVKHGQVRNIGLG